MGLQVYVNILEVFFTPSDVQNEEKTSICNNFS